MDLTRGIITSPLLIDYKPHTLSVNPQNPENLRRILYYALYWDKIIIPSTMFFDHSAPLQKDLVDSGILWRPYIKQDFVTSDTHTSQLASIYNEFTKIMNSQSSEWLADYSFKTPYFKKNCYLNNGLQKGYVRLTLNEPLPVPSANTPINEILEFKSLRKDELKALHNYLDECYDDILKAGDSEFAMKKIHLKLKCAIDNIISVHKESFGEPQYGSYCGFTFNISWKSLAIDAMSGSLFNSFCFSLLKASILGTTYTSNAGDRKKLEYISLAQKTDIL